MLMTKKQIILEIQRIFSNSCPNGFLLGWNKNRFFSSLKSICKDLEVINETDFNYSYCNSYDIRQKIDTSENNYNITLKASFILAAYSLYVTKYSNNGKSGEIMLEIDSPEIKTTLVKIKRFIENEGFLEIKSEDMDAIIPDVNLELATVATIEKCLFDDFE